MGTYRFEEMRKEFLPNVAEIYNHYILNSTATFHGTRMSDEEVAEIVLAGSERFKSYAIFDNGAVCGYCLLAPFKKREAYDQTAEVTIYLKPEYTGKGVGSRALEFLEGVAVEKGFHVLLAIICGENDQSINLFAKRGYEKCGHYREVGRKFGRLLDVVSYQKII